MPVSPSRQSRTTSTPRTESLFVCFLLLTFSFPPLSFCLYWFLVCCLKNANRQKFAHCTVRLKTSSAPLALVFCHASLSSFDTLRKSAGCLCLIYVLYFRSRIACSFFLSFFFFFFFFLFWVGGEEEKLTILFGFL